MNISDVIFRPATKEDQEFLWEILYQAIYVGPNEAPPPPSVLEEPDIARYLSGWGRRHDLGWIAENPDTNKPIGAAWLRIWPTEEDSGYGFYSLNYPELSIALLPEARGQGIGTALMERLIEDARKIHPGVSLSVSCQNPARRLYERFGFETISEDDSSALMILTFS